MKAIEHPTTTRDLGAPQGWDQRKLSCGSLPISDSHMAGVPCMYSYWQPTSEEIELIKQGAVIQLGVVGQGHPPVSMQVTLMPPKPGA